MPLQKELLTRPNQSIVSELQSTKDSLKVAQDDKHRAHEERDEFAEENTQVRSIELQRER